MVMYTNCQPSAAGTVLRRQLDATRMNVPCPEAVIQYNKHMGGVDRGDQCRGYYNCRMKSRKFYKYIFFFLLDVAITNAYILHKCYSPSTTTRVFKTIKDFRLELAKELIGDYCSRRRPGRIGGPHRSIPLRHFPVMLPSDGNPAKKKRGRCEGCKNKRLRCDTSWFCNECQVWLCHNGQPDDCFLHHHKKIL